jgi:hypothetical protein
MMHTPRALETPLETGSFSQWHSFTGAARIAAEGNVVWIAAAEGLRRYDFDAKTLSRPRDVPQGPCTAVIAGDGVVAAAVDGAMYVRDAKGRWHAEQRGLGSVTFVALDHGELWVAATGGLFARNTSGSWRSIDARNDGVKLDSAGLVSATNGVTWAWMYGQANDGHRGALVRVRGASVDVFAHPDPRKKLLMPSVLAAMPDGRARVGFYDAQGDRIEGGPLFTFDGATWTKLAVPGDPKAVFGTVSGSTIWLSTPSGIVRMPADAPADAPIAFPAPGEGSFIGAVTTSAGLLLLDTSHLRRRVRDHWTLFTAVIGGASIEKSQPDPDGWLVATGFAFRPGDERVVDREWPSPPASKKTSTIAGVPVHDLRGEKRGIHGPSGEHSQSDWRAWRAEFDPADVFHVRGLYREWEHQPPLLTNNETNAIALAVPLSIAKDSLVEADVKPVLVREGDLIDVRFEPLAPPKIVSTEKARDATAAFHRAHTPHGFSASPKFWLSFDAKSGDIIAETSTGGFYVTTLKYQVSLDGIVKGIWIWRWLKGE